MNRIKFFIILLLFIAMGFKIDILAEESNNIQKKDILIINSYDSKNKWKNSVLKGFKNEIKRNNRYSINLDIEYLDSKKRND